MELITHPKKEPIPHTLLLKLARELRHQAQLWIKPTPNSGSLLRAGIWSCHAFEMIDELALL
jgi:hypothetical protein